MSPQTVPATSASDRPFSDPNHGAMSRTTGICQPHSAANIPFTSTQHQLLGRSTINRHETISTAASLGDVAINPKCIIAMPTHGARHRRTRIGNFILRNTRCYRKIRCTNPTKSNRLSHTLCLVTDTTNSLATSYSSSDTSPSNKPTSYFDLDPITFGVDNCATHHVCAEKSFFTSDMSPLPNTGVRGIAGTLPAEGIGTISITIKDDNGNTHRVDLSKVIFPPSAAQNLISVSQWSRDRNDNCAVTSRGTFSVFCWEKICVCRLSTIVCYLRGPQNYGRANRP